VTTRTLVLGDWNPWIRDPIDALRALLVVAALGEAVGAYDAIPWFDGVVHFTLPFFLGPMLGIALGGLWEIWEWVSDHSFGSSLQLGLDDTVGDLVADTAGSVCGALLLVCWARYGWGSVRRIPGENRYEDTEA
jgi:hypothetical protein